MFCELNAAVICTSDIIRTLCDIHVRADYYRIYDIEIDIVA